MKTIFYRPQAHYWRAAIYAETDPEKLRALALTLVGELELHKAEFRAAGIWPPKGCYAPGEREEKFHCRDSGDDVREIVVAVSGQQETPRERGV